MQTIREFMQSDHKRLDDLFEMFQERKDTDQGEARRNFCPFRRGLFTHITWEEEILFPIFEERTGMKDNGPTFVMRAEHREIRDLLNRIREKIKAGDFATEKMDGALDVLLRSHNDKEENVLYPWIDKVAENAKDQKKIFDAIREMTPHNTCGCSH
ncbi:hypothetical protein A2Z10_03230 [Candidatus Azambacteria bacterium RBG_16_47_10]|uniref:Hemerythrin-like domain-containing protein n=1 Tax=Candidatus Azambacteria bacterium RBG_16_47_10 TaxID=1797292 RepID=A0A1F5B1I0_9BACT|nr:MAG: hypothetical protein A2Z10_03230 [Candidatus Azambacteria bacterium RBG_16_47_10]